MNTLYLKRIFTIALLLTMALGYGVLVGRYRLFPYKVLKTGYRLLIPLQKHSEKPEETEEWVKVFTEIPEEYRETDVESIISIHDTNDAINRRALLIGFLWGKSGFPSVQPSTITKDYQDTTYSDIACLEKIDRIVIQMEFGLESVVYHFFPEHPNNKLLLFHNGHSGGFDNRKKLIGRFLERNFTVLAFSMPLFGLNSRPTIEIPRIGKLKITLHDQLKFLSPAEGHQVKYFIEPIIVALNYIEVHHRYSSISMTGISGGAWTTTLAAAIDNRIINSFPVAGSYPIFLRSNSGCDWGDYEQTLPELYTKVNYLDLYILGAYGKQRKQLQILNQFDNCCFAGIRWKTYKDVVRSHIQHLGAGAFDIYMDSSHKKHMISPLAINLIIDEIERE